MMFSFETQKSLYQTKIIINTPINQSYVPKLVSPLIVIVFFLFFRTEVITFFQNFTLAISLGISGVGVVFTPLVSMIILSRFVIVTKNDKMQIGKEFWKINRFKTLSKSQITNI